MDHFFSPSQISVFLECNRKWAYRYVDGKKSEKSASAKLGDLVHKQLEDYLQGKPLNMLEYHYMWGKKYYPGEIAARGINLLPKPLTVHTEGDFEFIGTDGYKYIGRIDAIRTDPLEVWDHKTTRDFKWVKDGEVLKSDPQSIIYAKYALDKFHANSVDLYWTYFHTQKNDVKSVHLRIFRDEVEEKFRDFQTITAQMAGVHESGKKAEDLEPNLLACDNFGGCPHESYCPRSFGQLMSIYGGDSMKKELKEKLDNGEQLLNAKARYLSTKPEMPTAKPTLLAMPAPPPSTAGGYSMDAEELAALNTVQVNPPERMSEEQFKIQMTTEKIKPFTLCVDCLPVGEKDVCFLSELTEGFRPVLQKTSGVSDYRLVEYGKGKALLQAYILDQLQKKDRKWKVLVMDSRTDEAAVCVTVLEGYADKVFRGMR